MMNHLNNSLQKLCELELQLMIASAKKKFGITTAEDTEMDVDAILIGIDIGQDGFVLSTTAEEVLNNICKLDSTVHQCFMYGYEGAFRHHS